MALVYSSQSYKTLWIERLPPADGKYTSSREPSNANVPTGCQATDFMLTSRLPLTVPVQLKYENSAYWDTLSSRDQNDNEKRFHDLARQFREDTKKNPMNINLGNLDAEAIYTKVWNFFQADPKKRFCGNRVD